MSVRDYKNGRLLYHITSIQNLPSILKEDLLPRNQRKPVVDVADQEILTGRAKHGLDSMVPFHFFADNPFDGRVQKDHPQETFVFIGIPRTHANSNNWKISAKHPLNGEFELLDYAKGIETIDWDAMNARDYTTREGKSVCMAECLSPKAVPANDFQQIFVKSDQAKQTVEAMLRDFGIKCWVNTNTHMFAN
ncbi:DarT ssDNA thymidine ADP-ribosyltransferase family protein [Vibrio parahaemolyticus]|uniref:DarT ssDNA thymidine ADP-ribosyltransferase family protein n=1 Tax=Vibrio parahaemolyticus TaxID=670 RepID=UPI00084A5BE2|nr:DarT ssDNA thymidine ADP-ribosyltransferase family protein [Vibrio parahaemolyticus]ELA9322044.1 DUF4433 domain-containing protein [Vibrio parahaemolyticus]ELB2241072.1 DUF4433 domain-containing protein [Vibrio parahaemolyticus]ODZ51021.1 hypothetical protein BBM41_08960 [Vibrio parahaemolyticus]ODZ59624.1 hypothetical protein BBM42_17690 [Vibrio parahaemolyticus]HCE2145558.1 DUF4433 domain-containing protein [Vibrio parahaemolyticus]